VKLAGRMGWGIAALLVCAVAALAASSSDKKEKPAPPKAVDSGSFGVFINHQRVVTETFSVQQSGDTSVIKSELKETAGSSPADQKSSLEITATGALVRYEWSQTSPVAGTLVVMPSNEFLIEKITTAASSKQAEQSFLLPNTSPILDNNFFVHREVLAWRFLSSDCKPDNGHLKCEKNGSQFGVLVPQDRFSMSVRMELVGSEKITIRGQERDLLRINLTGEGFAWALWVDDHDQFKLMRVAIPADDTEVVRD
jgi:hypothetical protein